MKTLFLDFDGVLNRSSTWGDPKKLGVVRVDPIDPEMISNLNRVTSAVEDIAIVVSSTWRKTRTIQELEALLYREGLRNFRVIDKTPELHKKRGYEIRDWLLDHPERNAGAWCIVDDDADMLPAQKPRFVQTTFRDGLTAAKAQEIINILSTPTPPREGA